LKQNLGGIGQGQLAIWEWRIVSSHMCKIVRFDMTPQRFA
jgi:hypothetical protein